MRIRPSNCFVQSASSYRQFQIAPPEAFLVELDHLHWTSWTRTRAIGSGILHAETNDPQSKHIVRVVLSAPRKGCAPFHSWNGTPLTFTHISYGTQQLTMPLQACLPVGA
jgi:hypothetical protein